MIHSINFKKRLSLFCNNLKISALIRDKRTENIFLACFLVTTGATIYILNSLVPLVLDDYHLPFVWKTNNRIETIEEVVSAWQMRYEGAGNARISDAIVGLIMMWGNKNLFNILNTASLLINAALLSKLVFNRIQLCEFLLCLVSFAALPCVDGTLFWMSGSCNYLWSANFLLLFLLAVQDIEGVSKKPKIVIICAVSFICGMFHEMLGISLLGALCMCCILRLWNKQPLPYPYISALIFIGISVFIHLNSPALHNRVNSGNGLNLPGIIFGLETLVRKSAIPFCFLIWLALRKARAYNTLIGWFTLATTGLAVLVAWKSDWGGSYFFMCYGAVLLFLSNYGTLITKQRRLLSTFTLLITSIFLLTYQYFHLSKISSIHQQVINYRQDTPMRVADCSDYGANVPFLLRCAFTDSPLETAIYPYIGHYYNQKNFFATLRTHQSNVEVYRIFDKKNEQDAHVASHRGEYVIRLPKGYSPPREIHILDSGRKCIFSFFEAPFLAKLNSLLINRSLGILTQDYHDGFYYLFFQTNISKQAQLHFTTFLHRQDVHGKYYSKKRKINLVLQHSL